MGTAGLVAASRRYSLIRNLTTPMKAFLISSTGTFSLIIAADHGSRSFEASMHGKGQYLESREELKREQALSQMSLTDRFLDFARRERYKIVGGSWVASMIGSWYYVNRQHLPATQKIVQARVYAQGITLAVLVATAAFEISEQKRAQREADELRRAHLGVPKHERYEGENLWQDMVASEEKRLENTQHEKEDLSHINEETEKKRSEQDHGQGRDNKEHHHNKNKK